MTLREKLREFIDKRILAPDVPDPANPTKPDVAGVMDLLESVIKELVLLAAAFQVPGAEKKAAVIEAVQVFYDKVLAPIDIPWVPNVIEKTIVDPAIGYLLPQFAGWLVEKAVSYFKADGTIPA